MPLSMCRLAEDYFCSLRCANKGICGWMYTVDSDRVGNICSCDNSFRLNSGVSVSKQDSAEIYIQFCM